MQGSDGAPVPSTNAQDAAAQGYKPTKADEDDRTVFVGRLSFNVDHTWLKEEFESVGKVRSSRIITDRDGGSRGCVRLLSLAPDAHRFGYVEFETPQDAAAALRHDGKEIDGRPVRIDMSTPRVNTTPVRPNPRPAIELPPSSTLYVGNIPFIVTESQIRDAFTPPRAEDAPIASIRIPLDGMNGKPRGFAYVEFGDTATAQRTMERHNQYAIVVGGREVRLGYSTPRNQPVARAPPAGRPKSSGSDSPLY